LATRPGKNRLPGRETAGKPAIVTQLVNKSTKADLRATKMLIDMMKDAEKKTEAAPPPGPSPFTPTDKEVVKGFVERVRRALLQEIQDLNAGNPALAMISLPSVSVPARQPAGADGAA
jgi:hypothetical protein